MDDDYAAALALQLLEYEDFEAAGPSARAPRHDTSTDIAIAMMLQAEEFEKAYDPPPSALLDRAKEGRNNLRFRFGAVLQTYVNGNKPYQEREGVRLPYVCFEELVYHPELDSALITSFGAVPEWLDHVLPAPIPITCVCHSDTREGTFPREDRPCWTWIFPNKGFKKEMYKCFHPKLMVLYFRGSGENGKLVGMPFLRVVISSGSLLPEDYSHVENVLFVQDFPLLTSEQERSTSWQDLPEFPQYLARFLLAMDVPADSDWISSLPHYDYSRVRARLVASVPGQYYERPRRAPMELVRGLPNLRQFKDLGSVRLQSVIAELRRRKRWLRVGHVEEAPGDDDAAPAKEHFDMILQYQTSSLGDLSLSHWLRSFCYLAAGRLEPPPPKTVETQKRGSETTRRRKRQRVQIQRDEGFDLGIDDVLDPPTPPIAPKPFTLPITVVYPTQQHVVEMAKRGVVGGGTMMKEDQWEKPHFPKACLRTCESKRVAFMHSKILLAKLVEVDGVGNGDGEVCRYADGDGFRKGGKGYMYVGSHNFSLSAWGLVTSSTRDAEDDSDITDDGSGVADGRVLNRSIRMMNCELGAVLEVDENGVLVGEEDGNWLDADDGKGKGKGRILLEDEMKREVRIPVEAVLMHSVARPYADRDVPWMPEKWRKEQGKGTPVSEEV